jgi:sugar-phosphatase
MRLHGEKVPEDGQDLPRQRRINPSRSTSVSTPAWRDRIYANFEPIRTTGVDSLQNSRAVSHSTQVKCSAVLFDMDGVLVNSTPAVTRVWRQWAVEHGFNPDEVARKAHGRPSLSTIRDYLPHADHTAENREVERREIADLEGVIALPGVLELLRTLPVDRWTIVTSSTRPLAEVRLRAAGLPQPARLVTSNDITNGKPAPDPYRKGAEVLGFRPEECLVVEDVPAGIQSGKAAGALVIALTTTLPASELYRAGADWVLENCRGISMAAPLLEDGKLSLLLRKIAER